MRVLVVDDEENIRKMLRTALEAIGGEVEQAGTIAEAIRLVDRRPFDVAFVDVRLGNESGFDLLEALPARRPRIAIVLITAFASVDYAVEAMRRGAADFLAKPFTPPQVRGVIERVRLSRGLLDRVAELEEIVRSETPEARLTSDDAAMSRVIELTRKVAATDAGLLIRGENGVGKGVLARAAHAWSGRAAGPFVTVNCPSLNPELLESDLFGHVKGAFTGAVRDAPGKVAAAEKGTLFLDEIGDLPSPLQPKLLRFLQERKYERVGETITRSADVRLIAATNRDLDAEVAAGRFREDLYYRINVVELVLPPLRDRSDKLDLARGLLSFFSDRSVNKFTGFTSEAERAIASYGWPGNLRELRNAIERGVILAEGPEIGLADLPDRIARSRDAESNTVDLGGRVDLERIEAEHIRRVIATAPSLDAAAKILGVDPSTLFRKRKRYGL